MKQKSIVVKRLSPGTVFKVMFITMFFPWVLIDTAIILYHAVTLQFTVTTDNGTIALWQLGLGLYAAGFIISIIFCSLFWLFASFSLILWSQVSDMKITFLQADESDT